MFRAQLVGIYAVGEMPEQLLPFLNLQAKREHKQLKMGDKVAVFQIEDTSSFVVAFLSTLRSVEEMDARLEGRDPYSASRPGIHERFKVIQGMGHRFCQHYRQRFGWYCMMSSHMQLSNAFVGFNPGFLDEPMWK